MKKVIVVLVVLFIGILFAGCTSQPSPSAATPDANGSTHNVPHLFLPHADPGCYPQHDGKCDCRNVTAVPTAAPTSNVVTITFTQESDHNPVWDTLCAGGNNRFLVNNDPFKPHGIQSVGSTNNAQDFGTVTIPYGQMYNVIFSQKGAYNYVTVFQPSAVWKIVVS